MKMHSKEIKCCKKINFNNSKTCKLYIFNNSESNNKRQPKKLGLNNPKLKKLNKVIQKNISKK